jgi:hypothetical protein
MISLTPSLRIHVCLGSVDLRGSFDRLSAIVKSTLQADPLSGHLFVFGNARRNRLKVLWWDGSGFWVAAKRPVSHCPLRAASEVVVPPSSAVYRWNRRHGGNRTAIRHDRGAIAGRVSSRDSSLDG